MRMCPSPMTSRPTRSPPSTTAAKTVAVEPGGVEIIPDSERHGTPLQLLWTWTSPNLEFATIGVGIIGPLFFGLSFWQTVAAIVLGTVLGSATHGVLTSWGPRHGLSQMVLSRTGFGFLGNILPAGLNSVVAGIGWFAVNSISGALALHALVSGLPKWLCLVVIVAGAAGRRLLRPQPGARLRALRAAPAGRGLPDRRDHRLLQGRPRRRPGKPIPGAFLIQTAAAFGYACGWNPYAADYSRYLPAESTNRLPPASTPASASSSRA